MPIFHKIISLHVSGKKKQNQAKQLGFHLDENNCIQLSTKDCIQYFYNFKEKIEFECDMCHRIFCYNVHTLHKYINESEVLCQNCRRTKSTLASTNGLYTHPSQIPEVRQRYLNTIHEKYGEQYNSPSQVPEIKQYQMEQQKSICHEKYGSNYDNAMQVPEIKEKRKKTVQKRYGENYTSVMQVPEVQQKKIDTIQEKYGKDYVSVMQVPEIKTIYKKSIQNKYGEQYVSPFQVPECIEKSRQTIKARYGEQYDHISQVPEIRTKMLQTIENNKFCTASKQQKHIAEIVSGEIDKPFFGFLLDIALNDEKIDIEYDGGGHWLNVHLGKLTQKQFDSKQRKRTYVILNKQWKIIRLIAPNDKLPSDEKILKIVNWSKQWLLTHTTHIIYVYLEENRICSSAFDFTLDKIYAL